MSQSILFSDSAVAPPGPARHWNSIAQYLLALAVVVSGYFAYLKLAVPWIEGPPRQAGAGVLLPMAEQTIIPIDKSRLIPLLPEAAWELEDCKSLMTPSGTILFQKLEHHDDGTVTVTPFTMIAGVTERDLTKDLTGTANHRRTWSTTPTVLRCNHGANLKFNQPLADALQTGAKLELARLTGEVDIYRPPETDDQGDALHVLTRNVQVEPMRIYTLDQVLFSYGPHRGSGRNLMIDLEHRDDLAVGGQDFSSIRGVKRLELAFLDSLRLEPSPKQNRIDTTPVPAGDSPLIGRQDSPLDISCAGPFLLNFETQTITFQDQVVAKQLDTFQNQVQCDQLQLTFLESAAESTAAPVQRRDATATSPDTRSKSGLRLKRLVATGTPAVVLANSQGTRFTGDLLSYDAITRRIEARTGNRPEAQVSLVSEDYQVVAQHLQYNLTTDGSLGTIYSDGPGHLVRRDPTAADLMQLSWNQRLFSRQDPTDPQLQNILVDGSASLQIEGRMQLTSDKLTCHVRQWKAANGKWQFHPVQLIADQNVAISTQQMRGHTNRLTASWPVAKPKHVAGRVPYTLTRGNQQPTPDTVAGRKWDAQPMFREMATDDPPAADQPGRSWTADNGTARQADSSSAKTTALPAAWQDTDDQVGQPGAAGKPGGDRMLTFNGQQVDILLSDSTEDPQLVDLTLTGSVQVIQLSIENGRETQVLKTTGSLLRMVPQQGQDQFRIMVSSEVEAAVIETNELNLAGRDIHLDQQANKAWVDGPGRLRFAAGGSEPGQNDLSVDWNGGMIFDGKAIYFERAVRLEASRKENQSDQVVRSTSAALSVELNRAVDFRQAQATQQDATETPLAARELIFLKKLPVEKQVFQGQASQPERALPEMTIQHQTVDANGKLIEQQAVSGQRVIINAESGQIIAEGPGYLSLHRLAAQQSDAGKNGKDSANPLSHFSQSGGSGINFIQIKFDSRLNLQSRENKQMEILGRIRTVFSPVRDWSDTLDADQRDAQRPGGVWVNCDKLLLAQTRFRGASAETSELIATGNVKMNSDLVDSTADRVSYNQTNDMLIIEGTARTDANLWFRQTPNQAKPTHLIAEKILYHVSDQTYETLGVKNLNYIGQ